LETVSVKERKKRPTPEQRAAAVAFYRESGLSAQKAAEELKMVPRTLEAWIAKAKRAEIDPDGTMSPERVTELLRLQRENASLRREVEFLKKAGALLRERDHGPNGTR